MTCISNDGLKNSESRFGSFDCPASNDFVRRMLRALAARQDLDEIVVVLDNAPCHKHVEDDFAEPEFQRAHILRLRPYSPVLNGIENVFSVFKAHMKRFMASNRSFILNVLPVTTITAHRSSFLVRAAEDILPNVATARLCNRCIHRTLKFVAAAILMRDGAWPIACLALIGMEAVSIVTDHHSGIR